MRFGGAKIEMGRMGYAGQKWEKLCYPREEWGLGFRQLQKLNMAMVAKQAWRLLTRPESLVSKVFKAIYFRKSSLLDAKLDANPRYIWRRVWGTLGLLRGGMRWRIGSGESVGIWKYP